MNRKLIIEKAIIAEEIRNVVSKGERISIPVSGNSMNPLLVPQRDLIELGPYKDEDIRKGAIVLAKDMKGEYIIHRIMARNADQITLMGDGNLYLKETAYINDVVALAHSITRKGKDWTPDSRKWKFYSWVWQFLTPIRRLPLGIWQRANRHRAIQ